MGYGYKSKWQKTDEEGAFMKKWLNPVACSLISVIAFLLSAAIGILGNGDGTGYGGVVIVLCGLIIYCVVVIPVICFLYAKKCLSGQRFRFLFTIYQSFLITLPCFIWFSPLHSVILFAWCELWTLLGLVNFNGKTLKQKAE